MKLFIKYAFLYACLAMAGGVFFREFTKFNDFTGITSLGKIHTHLFMLGTFMFLILASISNKLHLTKTKSFKPFMIFYNTGLITMNIIFLIRGVVEVLLIDLSKGINASISGIAGISHIVLGIGFILLFISLMKASEN